MLCTVTHFYTVAHLTALTALKQLDPEFEAVAGSLKITFLQSSSSGSHCRFAFLPCWRSRFISSVNAMTTVSQSCSSIHGHQARLVAILNMDDAGDIAPAAAMGMMIFYTNVAAKLLHDVCIAASSARTTGLARVSQSAAATAPH